MAGAVGVASRLLACSTVPFFIWPFQKKVMFKIFATDVASKTFYWSVVVIPFLFVAMLLLTQTRP